MPIYLKHGERLVAMTESSYDAEGVLQRLLADYPALLAGDDDEEEGQRWLLIKRELGIAAEKEASDRWSVDHLFLDRDGVPTLVEVKRGSDTRLRREVVGQMLDYAANASVSWSLDKVRSSFETECDREGRDPDEELGQFLDGSDPDDFWHQVGTNLRAGHLRLLFVADEIPSELRRIVEYLNGQMSETEVLALEVRQYVEQDGERKTLVPKLIGQTEAARSAKTGSSRVRRRWTAEDFEASLSEELEPELAERMVGLYRALAERGTVTMGTGAGPSATVRLASGTETPVNVGFYPYGVAVNFDFVRGERGIEEMERLENLVRAVPGAAPYLEGLAEADYRKRPTMRPEDVLATDESAGHLRDALLDAAFGAQGTA